MCPTVFYSTQWANFSKISNYQTLLMINLTTDSDWLISTLSLLWFQLVLNWFFSRDGNFNNGIGYWELRIACHCRIARWLNMGWKTLFLLSAYQVQTGPSHYPLSFSNTIKSLIFILHASCQSGKPTIMDIFKCWWEVSMLSEYFRYLRLWFSGARRVRAQWGLSPYFFLQLFSYSQPVADQQSN